MKRLEGAPMAVLVESGRLKGGDILLEHSKGSLWGWVVRHGTGNYWNHILMVCTVRDYLSQGYDTTILVDPRMGGIRTDNIAHYLDRLDSYDVAVKRLEADWFQDNTEAGGLRYRVAVSDFALRETTDRYDRLFPLGLIRRTVRRVSLAYRFLWQKGRHPKQKQGPVPEIARPLNVKAYSCSGFVQWSYYRGVSRIVKANGLDRKRLQEVTFNPRLSGEVADYELLSITPADLAKSNKLSWKYVIKDGVVWEVSSKEEVNQVLKRDRSSSNER